MLDVSPGKTASRLALPPRRNGVGRFSISRTGSWVDHFGESHRDGSDHRQLGLYLNDEPPFVVTDPNPPVFVVGEHAAFDDWVDHYGRETTGWNVDRVARQHLYHHRIAVRPEIVFELVPCSGFQIQRSHEVEKRRVVKRAF